MKDPKGRTKAGFEHHIFICENKREKEHPRACCHDKGSSDIRLKFKQEIINNKLGGDASNGILDASARKIILQKYKIKLMGLM